ncbi:MAG: fibronectin type III domain-containing protein [Nitrospirae bacterium]|nr:fibronectin type III domain-containing protein [Nitrospirota bacterium]
MGTHTPALRTVLVSVVLSLNILLLTACGGAGGGDTGSGTTGGTLPAAPAGVAATAGDGQVIISWNPVSGATAYNLYMASVDGVNISNYNALADGMKHPGVTSPFTHTNLTNGKTYYFVVTAVNAAGESPESTVGTATPSGASQALFKATGSMITARNSPTATLLGDGTVLIAGGVGSTDSSAVAVTELYRPATHTFIAAGVMLTGRYNHTATRLTDGSVLIVGGTNGSDLASAEVLIDQGIPDPPNTEGKVLFDWSVAPIGSMAAARSSHTATRLTNGTVLIVGGYDGHAALASAELYDPLTGTFSATGNMTTGRHAHTATLLANGTVLMAGGDAGSDVLASTELYDPGTGLFSATGSMAAARKFHTATLLTDGTVLMAGGDNGRAVLASAELYDPATGLFSATSSMPAARESHTATLLTDGTVLMAGGNAGSAFLASAELYQ